MANSAAFLTSIRHQAGGLCTLQALATCYPPCSPPKPSHTQTFSASRFNPGWCTPGQEKEELKAGGTQEVEEEKKASGKSPRVGDLTPLHRPEALAWSGLTRRETLREKALHSKLSRLLEATSWLVQIEQTVLLPLLQQHPLSFHPKDSIEFRNICTRMALQREGQQFERDLHEAHQCLKTIIEKLICSLAVVSSDSYIPIQSALRQILQNLLAV
ncbi:LEU7 protein, partial [Piaya cayana]|nr:LEU7 protein [Piaya cayana]